MNKQRNKQLLKLISVSVIALSLVIGLNYDNSPQDRAAAVSDQPANSHSPNPDTIKSKPASPSAQIIESPVSLNETQSDSENSPDIQFIEEYIANLSDEERLVLEIQEMQNSVSKRVNNLSPGSLSEEELQNLFEDIDYLDQHAVFLGNEADQLKIYVRTTVGI